MTLQQRRSTRLPVTSQSAHIVPSCSAKQRACCQWAVPHWWVNPFALFHQATETEAFILCMCPDFLRHPERERQNGENECLLCRCSPEELRATSTSVRRWASSPIRQDSSCSALRPNSAPTTEWWSRGTESSAWGKGRASCLQTWMSATSQSESSTCDLTSFFILTAADSNLRLLNVAGRRWELTWRRRWRRPPSGCHPSGWWSIADGKFSYQSIYCVCTLYIICTLNNYLLFLFQKHPIFLCFLWLNLFLINKDGIFFIFSVLFQISDKK